jgi:hypothetical protein
LDYTNEDILEKLSHVLSLIPSQYVEVLLFLHNRFEGKGITWIVSGDLAEALRIVKVDPQDVEIVCSKADAEKIYPLVQEFKPSLINFQTRKLQRNAVIEGKEYPVFTRSYYFDFNLKGVLVKVQGDMRYKVGEWDWGDVFEFTPEYVYVVGKQIAVTPLDVSCEIYLFLGWKDRLEKIKQMKENYPH